MKILSIGYYDDFARFFLTIKKELLKEDKNIKFKYLSLYLSGYLYFFLRLQRISFFSLEVWIKMFLHRKKYRHIANEVKTYRGINLDQIISYHKLINQEDEKSLKLQAISYIDTVEKLLMSYKPDILILSGDSRMSIEILKIKAEEKNIKIYYFEQGPFGTTILDSKGVNANASMRDWMYNDKYNSFVEEEQKIKSFFKRKKSDRYKRNPFYRGCDYVFQYVFSTIGLLPVDIKMEKENRVVGKEYKNLSYNIHDPEKKLFLLILQVPYDVNMVYHSPFYKNHFEIVEDVYRSLPDHSQLLVREHPLYKGKYENKLYRFMSESDISLDIDDLYESIEKANVVIVNNSTVGIEAISRMKPVIVLGNSYYDNDFICLKLKRKQELSILLKSALKYEADQKCIMSFLDAFLNNYLINGHFRDAKAKAPKSIAKIVLNKKED